MIGLDTNLLVYAHRKDIPQHDAARVVVSQFAAGAAPWAIPWPCIGEFISVVTNPKLFGEPSTTAQAVDQIDAWQEAPTVRLLGERCGTWVILQELLLSTSVRRAGVHDARIAAICLDHGVRELWTADRDYSRFPALCTRNPLIDSVP
ncbi:MAG: TA system VapC family ribonuclease toxin [Pseudonocardiaceae bacterium]